MARLLKNNTRYLRHCVLYEFIQNKEIEKSYDDFCDKLGEEFIHFDQFEVWFYRFSKGKFDEDDQPISDMMNIILNDKKAFRVCILYESQEKEVPYYRRKELPLDRAFESYKRFCKVLGDDVIGYQEYYHWYQQFARFDYNLEDIEIDESALTLSEMPSDVMKKICENFYYYDRCALRGVNHNFLQFVGTSKFQINGLRIEIDKDATAIHFMEASVKSLGIRYTQKGDNCHVASYGEYTKEVKGRNHLDVAINDIKKFFENPKLRMKGWEVGFKTDEVERNSCEAFKVLEIFTSKIHVESIFLKNHRVALSILPLLKPESLQNIYFSGKGQAPTLEEFQPIFEMDQWKMAERFNTDRWSLPIENLFHFKKFHIAPTVTNGEILEKIKNVLFKNPNFEECVLFYSDSILIDNGLFYEHFGFLTRVEYELYSAPIYPIPNSKNEHIEIKVRWHDGAFPSDSHTIFTFSRKLY